MTPPGGSDTCACGRPYGHHALSLACDVPSATPFGGSDFAVPGLDQPMPERRQPGPLASVVVNHRTYVPREALAAAQRRLKLLAAATLSVLDAERARTGVDEWDETDQRCYLYNAASAIIERDANAEYVSAEAAERQIDDCLDQAQ